MTFPMTACPNEAESGGLDGCLADIQCMTIPANWHRSRHGKTFMSVGCNACSRSISIRNKTTGQDRCANAAADLSTHSKCAAWVQSLSDGASNSIDASSEDIQFADLGARSWEDKGRAESCIPREGGMYGSWTLQLAYWRR